ncbi:hypothetical protein AGMMS49959_04510 [Planctomycetales bacterium]|nr:hypothetical protein AGMMS49959_04510 [Planctomycetales bacterium]
MTAQNDETTLANEQASAGYATLKEIADAVFENICFGGEDWKSFLRTLGGAWNFSCPQIYLIHAQRPGLWEYLFAKRAFETNKWVLKDKAEGVVLPCATTDKDGEDIAVLWAVFDVKDFVSTDPEDMTIGTWTVNPGEYPAAISALDNEFRGEVGKFVHNGTLADYIEKLTAAVADKAFDYEWRYADHEDIENLRLEYGDDVKLLFLDCKPDDLTIDYLVKHNLTDAPDDEDADAIVDEYRDKLKAMKRAAPVILGHIKDRARFLRDSVAYAVLHRLELDTSKYTAEVFNNIILDFDSQDFIEKCVVGLARRIFKVLFGLNNSTIARVAADLPSEDAPTAAAYGLEATRERSCLKPFGYPGTCRTTEEIPTGYNNEDFCFDNEWKVEMERLQNDEEVYSDFNNTGFYIKS